MCVWLNGLLFVHVPKSGSVGEEKRGDTILYLNLYISSSVDLSVVYV